MTGARPEAALHEHFPANLQRTWPLARLAWVSGASLPASPPANSPTVPLSGSASYATCCAATSMTFCRAAFSSTVTATADCRAPSTSASPACAPGICWPTG